MISDCDAALTVELEVDDGGQVGVRPETARDLAAILMAWLGTTAAAYPPGRYTAKIGMAAAIEFEPRK